jgi:CRP-like cAMP-binding protein
LIERLQEALTKPTMT